MSYLVHIAYFSGQRWTVLSSLPHNLQPIARASIWGQSGLRCSEQQLCVSGLGWWPRGISGKLGIRKAHKGATAGRNRIEASKGFTWAPGFLQQRHLDNSNRLTPWGLRLYLIDLHHIPNWACSPLLPEQQADSQVHSANPGLQTKS